MVGDNFLPPVDVQPGDIIFVEGEGISVVVSTELVTARNASKITKILRQRKDYPSVYEVIYQRKLGEKP